MESQSRLAEILRHDRVNIVETGQHGTVQYSDDQYALVVLDGGYELTCLLNQISLTAH